MVQPKKYVLDSLPFDTQIDALRDDQGNPPCLFVTAFWLGDTRLSSVCSFRGYRCTEMIDALYRNGFYACVSPVDLKIDSDKVSTFVVPVEGSGGQTIKNVASVFDDFGATHMNATQCSDMHLDYTSAKRCDGYEPWSAHGGDADPVVTPPADDVPCVTAWPTYLIKVAAIAASGGVLGAFSGKNKKRNIAIGTGGGLALCGLLYALGALRPKRICTGLKP